MAGEFDFIETEPITGETGEVAEPQIETPETATETEVDNTGGETGTLTGEADPAEQQETETQPKQTPEQNAAYAKLRREADEAKKALANEQAMRDKRYADKFGKSHGIYTEAQYWEAMERQQQQTQEQQAYAPIDKRWQDAQEEAKRMKEAGYDDGYVNTYLKQQADILNQEKKVALLEQRLQQETSQRERERVAKEQEAFNQRLVSQFNQLKKDYPDMVKEPGDISQEVWNEFEATGKRDLVKAFKLANMDNLLTRTKAAAKQKTLNNLSSKAHLKVEGDGAADGGDTHIPPDTLQMYVDMGMTKKQAAAFHAKLYK